MKRWRRGDGGVAAGCFINLAGGHAFHLLEDMKVVNDTV
jgi:hypothetical protein